MTSPAVVGEYKVMFHNRTNVASCQFGGSRICTIIVISAFLSRPVPEQLCKFHWRVERENVSETRYGIEYFIRHMT